MLAAIVLTLAASPQLQLASYSYPGYDRAQALTPLARLIERSTGRSVNIRLFNTPEELANAVQDGRVDIAVTNLAAFVAVSRRAAVLPIAVLSPARSIENRYRGVLLARRETGVTSLAELRKRVSMLRYAEVLPGSTSGSLVQAEALRRAGMKRSAFASLGFAGSHDAALDRLLRDESDIAALAEAPWRALQRRAPHRASRVVQLWHSKPLPPGPIVCVQSVRIGCATISVALLRDEVDSRDAARALARGWAETEGATAFRPVDPQAYAPFIRDQDRD